MILPRLALYVPDGPGFSVVSSAFAWSWGDDVTLPFSLSHASGAVYPLSGSPAPTFAFAIREKDPDAVPLLTRSIVVTDAAAALFEVRLVRADRSILIPGRYALGLQFQDNVLVPAMRSTILLPSRVEIGQGIADLG